MICFAEVDPAQRGQAAHHGGDHSRTAEYRSAHTRDPVPDPSPLYPNSSDHDNTIELLALNDLFAQAKVTQPASPQTSVRDSMKIQNSAM